MPTVPPLVLALPYVAWILLATLAFGSFAFVVVTRQITDVTPGYARFTAVTSAVLALIAYLARAGSALALGEGALAINTDADPDRQLAPAADRRLRRSGRRLRLARGKPASSAGDRNRRHLDRPRRPGLRRARLGAHDR